MANASDQDCWIGLDLGGTKMLAVVYGSDFQQLGRERKRTKGHEGRDSVIARMIKAIRDATEDADVKLDQIKGIGIGVPGPVDQEQGVVLEAVNLSWENVPLRKLLQNEFGVPVAVVNDVDAGVYGEYRHGAAVGARTALGIFPGTGIGGGCVYDGQILRGAHNSCMEIGHIQVTENGRLCGCGQRGCLETEASRLAVSAEVATAAYRGEAPTVLKEAGTTLADIRSGVLAKSVEAGEVAVEVIMKRACRKLGVAVANVVHLICPDVVVLGGGLVEAMPKRVVQWVTESAQESVMQSFAKSFRIVPAKLGDDAAVIGAAAWAEKMAGS